MAYIVDPINNTLIDHVYNKPVKNISFYESLSNDSLINKKISNKDLMKMFNFDYHLKKINTIFNRVFK